MKFFIVIPPGFEELAKNELIYKWQAYFPKDQLPQIRLTTGGVEFETQINLGLYLNYILKIPNRILIRVDEFRCRDFPKLFKKLQKNKME